MRFDPQGAAFSFPGLLFIHQTSEQKMNQNRVVASDACSSSAGFTLARPRTFGDAPREASATHGSQLSIQQPRAARRSPSQGSAHRRAEPRESTRSPSCPEPGRRGIFIPRKRVYRVGTSLSGRPVRTNTAFPPQDDNRSRIARPSKRRTKELQEKIWRKHQKPDSGARTHRSGLPEGGRPSGLLGSPEATLGLRAMDLPHG